MNRKSAFTVFLAVCIACLVTSAQTESTEVWHIGKLDQSTHEFVVTPAGSFLNPLPPANVDYQVSSGDWAHHWPGEQRDGSVYSIEFDLNGAPRGVFTLKISALTSFPRVPALRIDMNGHAGVYYLHPKPIYLGDQRYRAGDVLTVAFPARDLKVHGNRLALTLVSSQASGAAAPAARETLAYDFLSLRCDPNAKYAQDAITADVAPTIFFRQDHDRLVEVVDAFVRFPHAVPAGAATLSLNNKTYSAPVVAATDASEQYLQFEVAEWQGTVTGRLKIDAGFHHTFNVQLTAERKWSIFVVPHTHVDIGYTDYQGKVAEAQAKTLVEAADLIAQYPDFRFATDGSWNLQQLLETRSKPQRDRILTFIQQGKIGIPADYFNLLTGYASLETLYRSLYYSKGLSREFNLPFNYATTTDVPSYTGAYPSVLASAGVKYWAVGANQDRATVLVHEQWNEKSPFWWQGPDGGKVLFWYSRGYSQISGVFGFSPQNDAIYEALPNFLAAYDRPEYKPDAVLMYGAQSENTDLHLDLPTFIPAWNHEFAYPRLQYATFSDFFSYIDKNYGSQLPTYKGDMGPYWEDGIGSDAYYAAIDRQNQSDALSTEIVSTVAHEVNPDVHPPKAELDDVWNNILLFAEHTWGAARSISAPDSAESVRQLAVKDNFATQASLEVEDITNRSLAVLARDIHVPARTLIVFNALNWKRDALVEADLNEHEELIDLATHQPVRFQVLANKENFLRVRFLAQDLPAVGYKCFQIRTASGTPAQPAPQKSSVIENQYYRITVDTATGAVASIFDKHLQRELVDAQSPYKFGQYIYVSGGDPNHDGMNQMIHPYAPLPIAELAIHPAGDGQYLGTVKTPFGQVIRLRSSALNTPSIDTEILLYDQQKKLEFRYQVRKDYTTEKEGVYFAFPAAVDSPQFAYATQMGWVDPAHDLLKGASLEWFNIQKWMAVRDAGLTVAIVPLDASLASFGDINRGLWPAEFKPKTATLFSYAMNNYWHTNYRAGQGGDFTFRYVLTSSKDLDPSALSRLGWESMEPPVVDAVLGQDKVGNPDEPLPAEGASFLTIDNPNIVLVTWKLAEDGKGTILRLKETAGAPESVDIKLSHATLQSARLSNSVEDDLGELPVSENGIHVTFHPNEVVTVRLMQ